MKRTTHHERTATLKAAQAKVRRAFGAPLACLALTTLATSTVDAQIYRWIDPDTGAMIISNNPPPSTVRPLDVRKPQSEAAQTSEPAAKVAVETNGAEPEKRANPCQVARQSLAVLESKQPASRKNAKGEQTLLNEAERAAELTKVREFLRDNC